MRVPRTASNQKGMIDIEPMCRRAKTMSTVWPRSKSSVAHTMRGIHSHNLAHTESWCSGDEFVFSWQCNSFISCFSDRKCVPATSGSSDMLEASSFSVKQSSASSIISSAVEASSTGDAGGPSGVPGLRYSAHKKPSVAVAGQPKHVGGVAGAGPVGVAMIS